MNSVPNTGCPRCASPIPPDAPGGLCPRCALADAAAPTQSGAPDVPRHEPPTAAEVAAAFPAFEIVGLVGSGGMGHVYRVRQSALGRDAALKLLPRHLAADPAFVERFTREARTLARLNHPDIVGVYEFGQSGGFCYLLMEFVDGANLRQAMRAGRFTPEQALAIVPRICDALQYAHGEGVLHRDIKPENILLDAQGRVKIADFGIAKLLGDPAGSRADVTLTQSGVRLGTPHYMAPEQIERPADVDHRADIYSLGVVFYELLTGELPIGRFPAPSEKAVLDARIDEIVFRALAKERELRQQSAGEVKTDVEGLADTAGRPGAASKSAPFQPRSVRAYRSTLEHIRSLLGWFYIYTGGGELRLEEDRLVFTDGEKTLEFPVGSITGLSLGEYPRMTKPAGLEFIAVRGDAGRGMETILFTPHRSKWDATWETNMVVRDWHEAIRQRVAAKAGRPPEPVPDVAPRAPAMGFRLGWMLLPAFFVGIGVAVVVGFWKGLGIPAENPLARAVSQAGGSALAVLCIFAFLAMGWAVAVGFRRRQGPGEGSGDGPDLKSPGILKPILLFGLPFLAVLVLLFFLRSVVASEKLGALTGFGMLGGLLFSCGLLGFAAWRKPRWRTHFAAVAAGLTFLLLGSYILILVRRQGGSPIEAPKVAMMQAIDPVTGLPVPPGLVRFRVHRSLHLPGEDSTEARWTIQSPSPATLRLSFRGKSIEAPMVRYGQGNGDFQNEVTVLVRRTPKGTMVVARFSEGADRAEIVEHMPGDPKELLKGFVEDLAMTSKAPLGLALLGDGAVAIEALEPVTAGGAPVTAQVVPAGPVRCQVKRTLMVPNAGGLELRWKIDASMPTTLRLSYKDKSVKKALVGHGIGDFRAEISIFFRPAGNGMVMAAGFKDGPDTAQIAEMLPGDPKELLAEAARVVSPDLALPVNTPVWLAFLDKSQVLLEALEPDPDEAKRPQETAAAIVREIELKAAKQRLEHVLRQLAEARMEFATARSQDPSLEEKGLQMRIELLLRESDELRLLIQKLAKDP